MDRHAYQSSFSTVGAYFRALSDTPRRLSRRAVSSSTSFEEMSRVRARSGSDMRRTLNWIDLIGFGIGGMVGAGVFVTTGRASRLLAGPAVIISYAIAGICALLSAFCYTEFAVDMPVAGGAFSYIRVTFGEFTAFLAGANLIIDYVLSNAAVARSFTAYFGTAVGISTETKWRIRVSSLPDGFNEMDLVAVAVVLIITFVICYSTRESSMVNLILTGLHIMFILFVIVIGFCKGNWDNMREPADPRNPGGFFPFGASGVFNGAATVYMSYIGYDAVSTMAEEVRNPVKDIPIGISGSVIIVTVFYCLMATSMSFLLPYDLIDLEAPFSAAFKGRSDGWSWVSNVIGVGASMGILTSMLVSMLGQARYMCVIGRSGVVPVWFARIHPKASTPVNASVFLGICTATIAMFTDLSILLNLVTIGTLFVFYMVSNAVIFRRYVSVGTTSPWPTMAFLSCFSLTSMVFTLTWKFAPNSSGTAKGLMLGACTVIGITVVQVFRMAVPQVRKPEFWGVPMMPWIPTMSIFLNVFLLGFMDKASYLRFGFFLVVIVIVYVLYGVHASFDAEGDGTLLRLVSNGQTIPKLEEEELELEDHTHDSIQV